MHVRWLALLCTMGVLGCDPVRSVIVENYPDDYDADADATTAGAQAAPASLTGTFDGLDAGREKVAVRLVPVVRGVSQATDVQFVPGHPQRVVVVEKGGAAKVFSVADGKRLGTLLELNVLTKSEQGLLGLAFHPDFANNGRLFVNHVVDVGGQDTTRVSEFTVDLKRQEWRASGARTVLEEPQPYANHNAGQLAFGPDGMLYVGFGDGGWRDDPKSNGQNASTRLGSMLRIDVDQAATGVGFAVPPDNPFIGDADIPPETWAIGLRNPWRYSFDPTGRLVVADVGQNTLEEVNVVEAGANLGWKVREGRLCFPPDGKTECQDASAGGLQDPVYVYGRDEGTSITGGFVYRGDAIANLRGRYIFGDFVSGRIWAIALPDAPLKPSPAQAPVISLGRFPALLSAFGQDAAGEVYVADYQGGVVYKIAPPAQ